MVCIIWSYCNPYSIGVESTGTLFIEKKQQTPKMGIYPQKIDMIVLEPFGMAYTPTGSNTGDTFQKWRYTL